MCIYSKHGGQPGYRGHVLNMPQNIQGFLNKLPRDPSELPVLVVRRHGADNTYTDCRVRREKVLTALQWLKQNNHFYQDITINQEVVQSLPDDGMPATLPLIDECPQPANSSMQCDSDTADHDDHYHTTLLHKVTTFQ